MAQCPRQPSERRGQPEVALASRMVTLWPSQEGCGGEVVVSTRASKKAVGYARVSNEERIQGGDSLEAQEASIRSYCSGRGWRLMDFYRDDGHSAWDRQAKRPAYEEMMARRVEWDVLVTYKLDRLWRRADIAIGMHRQLGAEGKELVSVTENIDTTTPAGNLQFEMLCIVADLYCAQISERVRGVLDHLFQTRPGPCLNIAPLGYCIDRSKGPPRYVLVPEEATTVRKLFAMAAQGMGLKSLGRVAGQMGLVSRRGKPFSPGSLAHILHNPFYCAYVYHRGLLKRASHDPIVTDGVFNGVQMDFYARGGERAPLPLLVGEDMIEVRRTRETGRHRGSNGIYLPSQPSPAHEVLLRGHGQAALRQARRLLTMTRERPSPKPSPDARRKNASAAQDAGRGI